MTSADIYEDYHLVNPIFENNWCFHILKIISFMESVVFNHLDDTLTSVFSKIIGSNVRFIVSSSEELIKYPILSFRLELMSIGQIRQFLVLTHFYASAKYSHKVDRVFLTKHQFHPSFLCHSQNKECCWQLNSWCIVEQKLCTILLPYISFTLPLTKTDPVTLTKRRSIPGKYKAYVLICVIPYSITPLSVFSNHKIHQKLFYNHFKAICELFYRHLESLNSAMFVCVYYENIFWMISRWNWICDGQWN